MFDIRVEENGLRTTVGMWGEFDAFSLPSLREALDEIPEFGRPVVVDLSEITFLDLQSTRELVVRSLIQAHQLVLQNPSPGVLASIRALGLEDRAGAWDGPGREEPQVFSEA